MNDNIFMQTALNLAAKGWPHVSPNPMVGCVITKDNGVVAEGFHKRCGDAHAEVNAINALDPEIDPADCTLYVTLEPCAHFGKTPPCTDLIIKKGFKKVVICNIDPNPLVSGKGIEKLREAGIEVITHVLEKDGSALNKRFFVFHEKKRPYYILKWTQTADGYISRLPVPDKRADNIISTNEHLEQVHQMRSEEMAIMVGKNTVLKDNPHLTTRLVKGPNPIRIFIDRKLEVPMTYNIYNSEAPTIIFNEVKNEINDHLKYVQIDFTGNVLPHISAKLFEFNILSVIVEGGLTLLNHFILEGLYDEVRIFENKSLFFGHGMKAPEIKPGPGNKK